MNIEDRLRRLQPLPAPDWNPNAPARRAPRIDFWMPLAAAGLFTAIAFTLVAPTMVATTPVAPQDPAVQRAPDPEPVTAPILSWYRLDRLDQKEWRHAGYAQESIIPVGGKPWAFEYVYELAFIFPIGEENLAGGRLAITAQLDPNGEAVTLDGFLRLREGDGRSLKLRTLPLERIVEMSAGDTAVKVRKALDDPATPIPSLMLFSAMQTRNLTSKTPLRYLDAWGSDPLLSLAAIISKAEKRPVLGRPVTAFDVELRNLSSILPELPAFTKFTLDRFGRILKAESADGAVRLQLVEDEKAALLGDRMLKESGMRDPFTRPNAKGPASTLEVHLPPAPRVASVPDSLAHAAALLIALRDDVVENREKAAAQHYADFVALYRELWPRSQGVDQAKLEKMRLDAEAAYGGVRRLLQRANALHDTIADFVEALRIPEAEKRLSSLKAIEDAPELWRQEQRADVTRLIAAATGLVERGRAMAELAAKKLVLTGIVVTDNPKQTFAIINDQRLRAGDVIDGVVVETITRGNVTVSLRGAKRDLALSK
jgi:hypothetical protein